MRILEEIKESRASSECFLVLVQDSVSLRTWAQGHPKLAKVKVQSWDPVVAAAVVQEALRQHSPCLVTSHSVFPVLALKFLQSPSVLDKLGGLSPSSCRRDRSLAPPTLWILLASSALALSLLKRPSLLAIV